MTISVIGIFFTVADKKSAQRGGWRVPEKWLFALAVLGASLAMFITMRLIRHKTRHLRFMIGLPVIFLFQAVLIYVCHFVLGIV